MTTYSVKDISEMLNTSEETVRRWIREEKLEAIQNSRKSGNVITEEMLDAFLDNYPKYANIAATAATANLLTGGLALPLVLMGKKIARKKFLENARIAPAQVKRLIEQGIEESEKNIEEMNYKIRSLGNKISEEEKKIEEYKKLIEEIEKNMDLE